MWRMEAYRQHPHSPKKAVQSVQAWTIKRATGDFESRSQHRPATIYISLLFHSMNYTKNPGVHCYWCYQDMGFLLKNRAKIRVFTNAGCQYLAMKGIPQWYFYWGLIWSQIRYLSSINVTIIPGWPGKKVGTATRAEKRDRHAGSLAWHGAQTRDENVMIVTKFPFWGGSLGGKCDTLERHADPSLRPHFSRYQGILMIHG